jgi:hypothetical protein
MMRTIADICLDKEMITKTEHERYFVSGIFKQTNLVRFTI